MKFMKKFLFIAVLGLLCLGCEKPDNGEHPEDTNPLKNKTLFILNEGGFGKSNASLSMLDMENGSVTNGLFKTNNGKDLGDLAQSMTTGEDFAWIVVNNSNCAVRIGLPEMTENARIENINSPRYIHMISESKAYLSQMGNGDIIIFNPGNGELSDNKISTGASSAESFIQIGKYVYVNCWSFGNSIFKINSETDEVEGTLQIGEQPQSMAADRNGNLWVLTDGGWNSDWTAHKEAPALHKVDTDTFKETAKFEFPAEASVSDLTASNGGDMLYFINYHIYGMSISAGSLPENPLVENNGTNQFYALGVSPDDTKIYAADACDYSSDGKIYEYGSDGSFKAEYKVGVCPGFFCWY